VAYARCARITRTLGEQLPLNPDAYQEEVERELHRAYQAANAKLEKALEPATRLGEELYELAPTINAFFDKVLVNADDPTLRQARLALVQKIAMLPAAVADLSKLQGF
jgi:glycyl-tRNA synthetase beta subunit